MASINRTVGFNRSRQVVSLPAALRARRGLAGPATELKSVDSDNFYPENNASILMCGTTAASGGSVPQVLMNMPVEGSSFYNRIARRTRGVALFIKCTIKPTLSNAATAQSYGRILIVYDRQANGATPALSAILSGYSAGGAQYTSVQTGLNPDNRDRFVILRDKKFILPAIGVNGVAPTVVNPNFVQTSATIGQDDGMCWTDYIKLNGLETQYKASTSGAIGDISSGSYLILAFTDNAGVAAPYQLYYDCRYSFYD